jgi:signal transduction histidine kinase
MFYQARLKLTLLYSLIFLILFWSFSAGIYLWMNKFFGDHGADSKFRISNERSIHQPRETLTEPPSDIIMDELRDVLLLLDSILLFSVPIITWFLTGNTLAPVQKSHEKEKQFLTDASHDLRTPLTILSGEIELTLRKERTKNEYKRILQSNKEEVDDLTALVENMLFFARENNQYENMQKEHIDVTDLLIERVKIFQKIAKHKKITLSLNLPEQSIIIIGNQQLIKRLFISLLDNAVKYTPFGGKINVKLNQKNNFATIDFADTGIGIPQEQQEKIFDRFFRADTSRTEKGYGLGLSIAKKIVAFHEGKIHVSSAVNKGTTVKLSFPLAKQGRGKNLS